MRIFSLCFMAVVIFSEGNAQTRLGQYNVDRTKITTSGISSGGAMAQNFHYAYSSQVKGAGIFASVPYMCGFGGLAAATTCMTTPALVNVPFLIGEIGVLQSRQDIDHTSNVAGSRVFIYHGSRDSVVAPGSGTNVERMYDHFGAYIRAKTDIASNHAHPTDNYGSNCGDSAANTAWISNCNYQGSYEMYNWLYGGGLTRPDNNTQANGDFILFDQSEFFTFSPALSSMDTSGYVYIPTGCRDRQTPCALHIAFHGCAQNKNAVGDVYAKRAGYLETAELNNIIVLFPQTVATVTNAQGCWDWFGYLNNYFPTKDGNQNLATHRMMNRIISG